MNVLIVYVTHTGSTLYAGKEVMAMLSTKHNTIMKTAPETTMEDIVAADLLVIGSSSWDWQGNRGYPLAEMMTFLDGLATMDFSQKKVALFGCGDRDFEHFCGALDVIWNRLTGLGAKLLVEHLRINRYFMDEFSNQELVRQWAKTVLSLTV
jgi:flavodoxin